MRREATVLQVMCREAGWRYDQGKGSEAESALDNVTKAKRLTASSRGLTAVGGSEAQSAPGNVSEAKVLTASSRGLPAVS
jgi:hypothetical protein